MTVLAAEVSPERVTVNTALVVPALPSSSETSLMENAGAGWTTGPGPSSLTIVPVPYASFSVAFVGAVRLTTKFSFSSTAASPLTTTVTVLLVSPMANATTVGARAT